VITILLLFLSTSCTTLVTEGELLHQWSLTAKLHSYKNAYVLIEDGEYQGINPRDLYRINQKVRLEVNKLYVKHVWDCEDKARALVHGVKSKGFYKYSPAVGTAHYITRKGVAHAINIAFDTKGSLYFFEPQTDQVLTLTEEEIASIRFLQL
jgi:hypothetical protein